MKRLSLILLVVFNIQSAIAQNTLDNLGLTGTDQATVAYSLRLLSTGYTGPLVRVNINNLFYDVYADDLSSNFTLTSKISNSYNTFDAASTGATSNSLSTISSGNTAKVAIWYDQSGNGTNLTQGTAIYQPRIINAGVIDKENNVPIIRFFGQVSGNRNALDLPSPISINGQVSVVNQFSGADGFLLGNYNNYYWHSNPGSAQLFDTQNASSSIKSSIIYQNGELVTLANASWNTSLATNNIAPLDPLTGTTWDNIGSDRGMSHNNTNGGGYAELITFNTALSTSSRTSLEDSQSSYFSIIYNGEAKLTLIGLSSGTLSPSFNISTYTYNIDVTTPTISITPSTNLGDNTILVNGNAVVSGSASSAIALSEGNNVITVRVTLVDGVTTQDYTLNVIKRLATTLSEFNDLNKFYFDESFLLKHPITNSSGTFSYTSNNTAVATISGLTVTIIGPGTTTITANQASDGTYESKSIAMTLTVSQPDVITKNGQINSVDLNYVNNNGALSSSLALSKNGQILQVKSNGNGLSAENTGTSAYQIKQDYPASNDGLYWISNSNINNGTPFQIYADMTTDGGGWTLIMCNTTYAGWNYTNAIALNTLSPSINSNYSIIGWADYIKSKDSGFQYMMDAQTRGRFGGIWTANQAYSFVHPNNTQTDVTLDIKFGTWNYTGSSIEKRMPWYSNCSGLITTSVSCNGDWWGSLITNQSSWGTAPWINSDCGIEGCARTPSKIWYWVR